MIISLISDDDNTIDDFWFSKSVWTSPAIAQLLAYCVAFGEVVIRGLSLN
jgi:hypothetical protein